MSSKNAIIFIMKCLCIVNIRKIGIRKKWEPTCPLKDYIDYIEKLKQINFPIRLKFGLEVCYSPEHEIDIAQILLEIMILLPIPDFPSLIAPVQNFYFHIVTQNEQILPSYPVISAHFVLSLNL